MALSNFKTLLNVGMNTVNDYKVPVTRTVEKNKVSAFFNDIF